MHVPRRGWIPKVDTDRTGITISPGRSKHLINHRVRETLCVTPPTLQGGKGSFPIKLEHFIAP